MHGACMNWKKFIKILYFCGGRREALKAAGEYPKSGFRLRVNGGLLE